MTVTFIVLVLLVFFLYKDEDFSIYRADRSRNQQIKEFQSEENAGERIDKFLTEKVPELSVLIFKN